MQIVNGYVCQNCTDVENAKKFVDPAHPKPSPAPDNGEKPIGAVTAEAVTFGGTLSEPPQARRDKAPASRVDIKA